MTKHDRLFEQLSAYLDGELTPSERTTLERQLAEQPELREQLEKLRAIAMGLREEAVPAPPSELAGRISRALRTPGSEIVPCETPFPQQRRWARWGAPLAAAATLVSALLLGVLYERGTLVGPTAPAISESLSITEPNSARAKALKNSRNDAVASPGDDKLIPANAPRAETPEDQPSLARVEQLEASAPQSSKVGARMSSANGDSSRKKTPAELPAHQRPRRTLHEAKGDRVSTVARESTTAPPPPSEASNEASFSEAPHPMAKRLEENRAMALKMRVTPAAPELSPTALPVTWVWVPATAHQKSTKITANEERQQNKAAEDIQHHWQEDDTEAARTLEEIARALGGRVQLVDAKARIYRVVIDATQRPALAENLRTRGALHAPTSGAVLLVRIDTPTH